MFSTITTFGAPHDVTLAELAVETFYPADDHSPRFSQREVIGQRPTRSAGQSAAEAA